MEVSNIVRWSLSNKFAALGPVPRLRERGTEISPENKGSRQSYAKGCIGIPKRLCKLL